MIGVENRIRVEWVGDFEYIGGWYIYRLIGMRK